MTQHADWYLEWEAELLRLGKWVDQHYEGDFMVDGHVMTNREMFATRAWRQQQAEQRAERDGCCGGLDHVHEDGFCVHIVGVCPAWQLAREIMDGK